MNREEKWHKFISSGKIEDYLEYNESRLRSENLIRQIEANKGLEAFGGFGLTDEGEDLHAGDVDSDGDGNQPDSHGRIR